MTSAGPAATRRAGWTPSISTPSSRPTGASSLAGPAAVHVGFGLCLHSDTTLYGDRDPASPFENLELIKTNDQVGKDSSLDTSLKSEAEVLRSDSIALAVVNDLQLTEDPEFVDSNPG